MDGVKTITHLCKLVQDFPLILRHVMLETLIYQKSPTSGQFFWSATVVNKDPHTYSIIK